MEKKTRNKRVSKDEWLSAALDMLESGGESMVRVERLASKLGISRSGFYWHFQDRRDLLKHLLDYWVHEYTGVVTNNPLFYRGDPKKRLEMISKMVEEHNLSKYDLSIFAWAKQDPIAKTVMDEVIKLRYDFIRMQLSDLGFEGDALEMRTMHFVAYHFGESVMFGDTSSRKLNRLRKLHIDMLTKH
jgi:AcrR family transcriptional regulator